MRKKNSRWRWRQFLIIIAACQVLLLLIFVFTWPRSPVIISFIAPGLDYQPWFPLIEQFEKQNPDIKINVVKGPYTTDKVEAIYRAELQTNDPRYDIVYTDTIWLPQFAANDFLLDLSEKISPQELDEFLPETIEVGTYQGKLYRLPLRSDVGVLYYRRDLLEAGGYSLPETFNQLEEISQNLQAQNEVDWGFIWQGSQYEGLVAVFVEILKGYGGFWINSDTLEVGLERPEAIKAVEFLRNTIETGISPPEVTAYAEEETLEQFKEGKAVFLRSWPYAWAIINSQDSAIAGKVGITSTLNTPGYNKSGCQGGWGLSIAKNSKHPEEAWRVIEFFTSEEMQKQLILDTGYVPSRKKLFMEPEIVEKYEHFPLLLELLDNSVSRPKIAEYNQVSGILQRYLSQALRGANIKETMAEAAKETREVLGASL